MRARMSSITAQIEPEHPELFALEFGKIVESDFVYTLASTNIDQSSPTLVLVISFPGRSVIIALVLLATCFVF